MIEMVNDKSCSDILIPSKEPQECFDKHLEHYVSVKMRINRSISLPSVSTLLDYGKVCCYCYDLPTLGYTYLDIKYRLQSCKYLHLEEFPLTHEHDIIVYLCM